MIPATETIVFDREGLLERLGGDTELLAELLEIFLGECREMMAAVQSAVDAGDANRIERSAHSLKGALLNISAEAAAERALQLEQVGCAGELELASSLLDDLQEEIQRLEPELRS